MSVSGVTFNRPGVLYINMAKHVQTHYGTVEIKMIKTA